MKERSEKSKKAYEFMRKMAKGDKEAILAGMKMRKLLRYMLCGQIQHER